MASPTASASPSGLPTGISAPLEAINDSNQGGLVAILAAVSLCLVLISIPIRTYVRSKLGKYKMDDFAFIGASIFAVLQAATVFYQLRRGLGKSEELNDPNDVVTRQKAAYASDILYIVAMFLSKCSTAFLFLRLTPGRGHAAAIWGTISASVVWAVVSIFLVALRCHTSHPWSDVTNECTGLFARWEFVGTFDSLTEAALVLISVYLVWGIRMPMKSKAVVVAAFACRLPVIVLAALRLYFLNIQIHSSNISLSAANTASCTQLEIGYSIMASVIPCMKTFMMPYDRANTTTNYYRSYASGNGGSHKLSSIASNSREGDFVLGPVEQQNQEGTARLGTKFMGKLRPEQTIYEAKVVTRPEGVAQDRKSIDSGNSRRMIIKKGVEWSVDYDGRNASPAPKDDDNFTIEEVNTHER